jgi:hypothetical protein
MFCLSDRKNDPIEKFPNCSVPQTLIDSNDRAQFERLQQLRGFQDADIKTRVDALWATDTEQLNKSGQIAH